MEWYKQSIESVLRELQSNTQTGLSQEEAATRLQTFGPNELIERGGRTRWQILREQLTGIMTLILFAAALISIFLDEYIDAGVILAIIALNAFLGYTQEYKAEQSMAALKQLSVPNVRVRRSGQIREISARNLVPGDVVLLETGNRVPADGRVTESVNLRAQEAALTGESEAVDKVADQVFEHDRPLGDRRNMLYSGTIINYGHGAFVVTATGMATELGHIANLIQSVEEEKTPLQHRLDQLGKMLAVAAIIIVAVIFTLGVLRGEDIEVMLLTAVSLAVAAIPEAMTAVVTIALSLGAQRMLKRRALIRKLPAVETLGSVTVICSDKTGTLTQNQMTVTVLDIANQRLDLVQQPSESGVRFVPREHGPSRQEIQPTLDLMLVSGALCNDAMLTSQENGADTYKAIGDPTEGALVLAAAETGILKSELDLTFPRILEVPFDSDRKRMSTLHRTPQSLDEIPASLRPIWERRPAAEAITPYLAVTKGAIDGMLQISSNVWVANRIEPLDQAWHERIMEAADQMAADGMRVLGVAIRPFAQPPDQATEALLERDLIIVGLFGMIDPPRPEVKDAVHSCRSAGIRPVMITGDHPLTALNIAQDLGITDTDRYITGQQLDTLSASELHQAARDVSVFARVSPEHKIKLIRVYQEDGHVVAMTGDGVNDAPALKKADIGVAMGIAGTDVSKEAAKMVLLDDNFATIVAAVEEGRVVYDNIRKFIKYLLSCNASEIGVMLFGPFLGLTTPLLPLQILWMNLVTDGLPALALGVEPAEEDVMQRPPSSSTESVFGGGAIQFIIAMGLAMSVIALSVGLWFFFQADNERWQTILFTTLIFSQLALAISVRSERQSLFHIGLLSNKAMLGAILVTIVLQLLLIYTPFLQVIFDTDPLSLAELGVTLGISVIVWVVVEVWKFVLRRRKPATALPSAAAR
jgi:Ca2+-transporting ATPase